MQNIWICYFLVGLCRGTSKGRFVDHLCLPSNDFMSSYFHAVVGVVVFFLLFDRKYFIAAFVVLLVTAIYAIKAYVTFVRDLHRVEDTLSFAYPRDRRFYPLLVGPIAAWCAWIILCLIHVGAIICVHELGCDDETVSIVTACFLTIGYLIFVISDVVKLDTYTRRVLGPYLFVCLFLIGAVINPIPVESASKIVVICCTSIALLFFLIRIILMCYRNKYTRRADISKNNEAIIIQTNPERADGKPQENPCFVLDTM